MKNYTRKCLAQEMGVGIETLRYYEKMKIIPAPLRAANGYRVYSEDDYNRINHIIVAKKYGFTLKEIKTVFDRSEKTEFSIDEIKPILNNKLKDIDRQIQELNQLKDMLYQFIQTF